MRLDDKIDMEVYLNKEIEEKNAELSRIQNIEKTKKDVRRHIDEMRTFLQDAKPLKEFDCQVFESIVEKVIVGGYDEQGNADPLKITFVYKTGFTDDKDGRDYKHSKRHAGGPKPKKLLQHSSDEAQQDVQHVGDEARGDGGGTFKGRRSGTHFANTLKIRHDLKRKMGRKIFRLILRFSIVWIFCRKILPSIEGEYDNGYSFFRHHRRCQYAQSERDIQWQCPAGGLHVSVT